VINPAPVANPAIQAASIADIGRGTQHQCTALVQALLVPGDHVVDLGANLGYYSLLAARIVAPRGRVWAFEPEPENCRLCRLNVSLNGIEGVVAVRQLAIGDRDECAALFRARDNHGAHQVERPYPDGYDPMGVRVDTASLDCLARTDPALARIDLAKIDIQGYELKALLGMRELIDANQDGLLILCELHPGIFLAGGESRAEWSWFLRALRSNATAAYLVADDPGVVPMLRRLSADEVDCRARDILRRAEELDVYRDVGMELVLAFSTSASKRLLRALPSVASIGDDSRR
jgi:FkbM family methyltransferase